MVGPKDPESSCSSIRTTPATPYSNSMVSNGKVVCLKSARTASPSKEVWAATAEVATEAAVALVAAVLEAGEASAAVVVDSVVVMEVAAAAAAADVEATVAPLLPADSKMPPAMHQPPRTRSLILPLRAPTQAKSFTSAM